MSGNPLIVQKYGGSSLATVEDIQRVAKRIAQLRQKGQQIIVVVSAMGKTTDELVGLAHTISRFPDRREMDMLVSVGERISMALLTMALKELGCDAISFTGSQAGILTNGSHSQADIAEIRPIRVEGALAANRVIVIAGFQGVNPQTKEITTLGRGGSDLTAVMLAHHFKAQKCQLLKDVDGVYDADPKLVPSAQKLPFISYDHLAEMCSWGAKVIHPEAIARAKKLAVPLEVTSSFYEAVGTEVITQVDRLQNNLDVKDHEQKAIDLTQTLTHFSRCLIIQTNDRTAFQQDLEAFLQRQGQPLPRTLACPADVNEVWLTDSHENIDQLHEHLNQNFSSYKNEEKALLTVHNSVQRPLSGRYYLNDHKVHILCNLSDIAETIEQLVHDKIYCPNGDPAKIIR